MSQKATWFAVCVCLLLACGGDDSPPSFSGSGGSGGAGGSGGTPVRPCERNADCNDGLYCTGIEICDPENDNAAEDGCVAGSPVTCDDGLDCTTDQCLEAQQLCRNDPPDSDSDGHVDATCLDSAGDPLGDDCDDDDASRFPGAVEVCDQDDHDEDCDAETYGVIDQDGDLANDNACCNVNDEGERFCGDDCKDLVPEVNPSASEVCDTLDNDCDGNVDEGSAMPGFVDADYDGYGDATMPISACAGSLMFSLLGTDCDDNDSDRNPGQVEVCDTKDNDCNDIADDNPRQVPWYADTDGDGFGDPLGATVVSCAPILDHVLSKSDCNDQNGAIHPAAAEACDGVDNNCNGALDFAIDVNDLEDDDGDGLYDAACLGGTDCDDDNATTGLGGDELCDGRDNDCDDAIDEGTNDNAWFRDDDHDGYGDNSGGFQVSCAPIEGRVTRNGDCNDNDAARNPGATELCNRRDDDCDGAIDGADADPSCNLNNALTSCGNEGRCVIESCTPGFLDCDRMLSNGCEELVGSDRCDGAPADGGVHTNDSGIIAGSGGRGGFGGGASGFGGAGGIAGAIDEDGGLIAGNGGAGGGSMTLTDGCGADIDCGTGCVDTLNDINNCGGCGVRCGSGQCMDGLCECLPSQDFCDAQCISTRTDSNNCGGCNVSCPAGNTCVFDNCQPAGGSFTVGGQITSAQGGSLGDIEITVEPPVVTAALTQADGSFSMQLPAGNYRFSARNPNASMRFSPAHAELTVGMNVNDVNFNGERGATLSGTLNYAGPETGRIYVMAIPTASSSGGARSGVSVAQGVSSWSIDGVPPGTYQLVAYLDHLGISQQHAMNPAGGQPGVVVNGNDIGGLSITLTNPVAVASAPPQIQAIAPSSGSALLLWQAPRDTKGMSTAEHFNIYFRRNAPPNTVTYDGRITNVRALESDGNYLHNGLVNGDNYYYLMTSVVGGVEGGPSSVVGPITVGSPNGGHSVSGVINSSNFVPSDRMTVVLFSEQAGVYFTTIENPVARQSYTISGVQPGVYQHMAFIDDDNDNMAGPHDTGSANDFGAPTLAVGAIPITNAHLGLTAQNARLSVVTMVHRDQNNLNVDYSVGVVVDAMRKPVVGTRLIAGVGAMLESDLIGGNDGDNGVGVQLGGIPARVGDVYTVDVTYDDGMIERLSQPVRTVVNTGQLPLPITPAAGANLPCAQPTMFSWQAPPSPPPAFTYTVQVHSAASGGGNRIFEASRLSSSQTNIAFPGQAPAPNCSDTQRWSVEVVDREGNRADTSATYTFAGL